MQLTIQTFRILREEYKQNPEVVIAFRPDSEVKFTLVLYLLPL